MSNKIHRDKFRRNLISKYELFRVQYKSILKDANLPKGIKAIYVHRLNLLPRSSSKVRSRNRCILTGRSRAVFRFCKLSRILLRELAGKGKLPGITKSSW